MRLSMLCSRHATGAPAYCGTRTLLPSSFITDSKPPPHLPSSSPCWRFRFSTAPAGAARNWHGTRVASSRTGTACPSSTACSSRTIALMARASPAPLAGLSRTPAGSTMPSANATPRQVQSLTHCQ